MELDNQYHIETDTYNVTLVKKTPYEGKDGEEKVREDRAYYATVRQALGAYVNESLKPAEDVSDLLKRLISLEEKINELCTIT